MFFFETSEPNFAEAFYYITGFFMNFDFAN